MATSQESFFVWYSRHAGFPARRLASSAELLLLFAIAAEADESAADRGAAKIERQNVAEMASRRQQAENRRRAHFKSDNRVNT